MRKYCWLFAELIAKPCGGLYIAYIYSQMLENISNLTDDEELKESAHVCLEDVKGEVFKIIVR